MGNKEIVEKMLEASEMEYSSALKLWLNSPILNTEISRIEVGPYLVQSLTPETVYITHKDGEGGEFQIKDVEKVFDILWWARF